MKQELLLFIPVHLFLMIQLLIASCGEGGIHLLFVLRLLKVTVLIINRNRANLLNRVILSSITQSLPDIEIMVADDASTDSSVAIISAFAERDSRIHFFSNVRQLTINGNRAKGVRASKGLFVLSVDSDDELCNQTAEIDFQTAIARQADMVEHMAYWVLRDGRRQRFGPPFIPFEIFNNSQITRAFRAGLVNWTIWRKFILRRLYSMALDHMGHLIMRPMPRASDMLHMTFIYFHANHFVRVNYYGYIYYWWVPGCATSIKHRSEEERWILSITKKLYRTKK
jgi:glycosyltransferase involved in cell wall biosynthesis